jgi:hypothetical protein
MNLWSRRHAFSSLFLGDIAPSLNFLMAEPQRQRQLVAFIT